MTRIVKDPEERRQEIVEAARYLFETQDYEKTTIRDVMEHVGIAKGTIYHYFKSKEELLDAVVELVVGEYIGQLRERVEGMTGSALEKLQALIAAGRVEEEQTEMLDNLHRPGNVGMHTRLLAATIVQVAPLYAEVIQQGCEEGVFRVEHPLEASEFILIGTQFLTDMGIYPWTEEDLMRRAMAIPALVEAQLNAPAGSFSFLIE
jgi:AcrR family transcriptional regulator